MRKHAQTSAHIEFPDEVGCATIMGKSLRRSNDILAIAQVMRVETTELALGGDIVEPVAFNIRRAGRRRQEELSEAALDSRGLVLPKEFAIRCSKSHKNAAFLLAGGI